MNGTPRRSATRSSTSAMPTPASPDVQRYRGAVIGAGGTARQAHLPALRTGAGVRARIDIVAVVDRAVDVPPVDGIPLLSHPRSEEHTSELQSQSNLVCRLLLEQKKPGTLPAYH